MMYMYNQKYAHKGTQNQICVIAGCKEKKNIAEL